MKYSNETNLNYIVLNELSKKSVFLNESDFHAKYWVMIDLTEKLTGLKDNTEAYNMYKDYMIMWESENTEFYDESVISNAISSIKTESKL